MVESAQWANADKTVVHATIDGTYWQHIRMEQQSDLQGQVQDWIDAGNEPASYDVPFTAVPYDTGQTIAERLRVK